MQEDTNAVPNRVRILLQNNLKIVLQEDTKTVVSGNRVCISRFLGLPLFPPHLPSVPLFPFAIVFSSSSSSLAVSFAVPSPPPSQQPLSRLSLFEIWTSLSAVLLPRPLPPRQGASAATTTTSKCFRGHPHHHVSLSLWHFLLLPSRRPPPLKAISFSAFIQFFVFPLKCKLRRHFLCSWWYCEGELLNLILRNQLNHFELDFEVLFSSSRP